jgi:hypothetical protein
LWGIGAILFFFVALLVGGAYKTGFASSILCLALGIALGTMLDAFLVETLLGLSRNLWPIDIVFWWLIGIVPMAAGFWLGRLWQARIAA